jgi:uncharacterized membrane protein YciS (DUF1049 family)
MYAARLFLAAFLVSMIIFLIFFGFILNIKKRSIEHKIKELQDKLTLAQANLSMAVEKKKLIEKLSVVESSLENIEGDSHD